MGRPSACHCICGSEICTGCELSSNLAKVEITFNGSFTWGVSDYQGEVMWNYVPSGTSVPIYLEQYASDLTKLSGTLILWKRILSKDYALSSFTEYQGDVTSTCRWYNDFPVIYQYVHHNSILSGNMEGELPGSEGQSIDAELEMVLAYVPVNYLDDEDPWNRQLKVVIDATGDEATIEFDTTSTWTVPTNTRRVMVESWGAGASGGVFETERSFLPSVDIANIGLWIAEGSSPLWQCINEVPVSNTDYIYSPVNAVCTYETRLSNTTLFPSPAENTFTLHYRMCKSDADGNHSIDAVIETARPSGHVNEEWNVYNHSNINEEVYSPDAGDGAVCYTAPPQDLLIRASDSELDDDVLQPAAGDSTYLSYGPYSPSTVTHTFELQTTAITDEYTNLSVWFYWQFVDVSDDTHVSSVRLRANGSYYTGTIFGGPVATSTWAWTRVDFTGTFTNPSLADYAVEISITCPSPASFNIDTLYLVYDQPDPPYYRTQQWNLSVIDVPTAPSQYDLYIRWRVDSNNYSSVTNVRVQINGSWYTFAMDTLPVDDTWIWSHGTKVGSFGSASSANYVVEITAVHSYTTGTVQVDNIYLNAKLEGAAIRTTVSFGRIGTPIVSNTHLLPTHPTDYAITLNDSQKAALLISPTALYVKFVTTASGGVSADQRGCSVFGTRLAVTTPYVGTGGGGGGAYLRGVISLNTGDVYNIIIGEGGNVTTPDGGSTRLEKPGLPAPLLITNGGKTANSLVGGAGGASGTRIGGHGGTASITGGGGGSSASIYTNGNDGGDGDGLGIIGGSGASAPPEGGKGGKGGTNEDPPEDGEYPGGGGGGLGTLIVDPGEGADGKLKITHQPGGRCGICVVDSFYRPPLPNAGDVICVAGDFYDDNYYGWQCTNSHLETSIHMYVAWGYPPYHVPGVYCTVVPRTLVSSTTNKIKYWVLDTEINIARAVNRDSSAHPLGTPYLSPVVAVNGFANGDNNHQQFSLSGVAITVRFAKTIDCETDTVGEEIELIYSNKFTGIADPEILTSIPSSVTMVLL